MIHLTKEEAKNFILYKQGLLGDYKFQSKIDVLSFFEQVGCIQFDPIDICGRNADIVLFSRVKNYDKSYLDELLYKDYMLVDQWDKVMSIYPITDWPKMKRVREINTHQYDKHLKDQDLVIKEVIETFERHEYLNAKDFDLSEEVKFYNWRHKTLDKAIIDYLFFKGECIIHHRDGVKRYFSLAKKHINEDLLNQAEPFATDDLFHKFQIKRRIGAIGLLSAGASDAYLGVIAKAAKRKKLVQEMVQDGELVEVLIEDIKDQLYMLKEDVVLLGINDLKPRVEFIAPLDNFIWDRKLIDKIFDFKYKWEIYHPPHLRHFAPYALPILYGNNFIGQIEMAVDRKTKTLLVKNIWYKNKKPNKAVEKKIYARIKSFAKFNDCIDYDINSLEVHIYN